MKLVDAIHAIKIVGQLVLYERELVEFEAEKERNAVAEDQVRRSELGDVL